MSYFGRLTGYSLVLGIYGGLKGLVVEVVFDQREFTTCSSLSQLCHPSSGRYTSIYLPPTLFRRVYVDVQG